MSIRDGKGGEGIAGRGEMCSSKNSFKKPCSKAIVQTGRHTHTIDRLLYLDHRVALADVFSLYDAYMIWS